VGMCRLGALAERIELLRARADCWLPVCHVYTHRGARADKRYTRARKRTTDRRTISTNLLVSATASVRFGGTVQQTTPRAGLNARIRTTNGKGARNVYTVALYTPSPPHTHTHMR